MDLLFGSDRRILKASDFQKVVRFSHKKVHHAFFVLSVYLRPVGQTRLGITITKRNVALAVQRNRFKRLIRESFRQQNFMSFSLDIVIFVKKEAKKSVNALFVQSLESVWEELRNKLSASLNDVSYGSCEAISGV